MRTSWSPCLLLALCAMTPAAFAQWSADPANNFAVGDGANDQVQTKVVPTTDGGCYISWYDNTTGGYDVRLQRLNAAGVEQWPHNGVLVIDRGVSSTTDYSLVMDADGNAIIAFNNDVVAPGTQQITVQKVSPAGALLWGAGSTVSSGTGVSGNARLAALTDGTIAVGWTQTPGWFLRRIDANGTPQGAAITTTETGHTIFLCDLQPGDNGTVIAMWSRSFGTNYATTSKWLFAQKYSSLLAPTWTPTSGLPGLAVYAPQPSTPWPTGSGTYGTQGGSIQSGYFPYFISDGQGGAVFAWYENSGPRNAYLQHILADGTLKFAPNGVSNALTGTTRMRLGASLAYDPAGPTYYVASVESDASPQTNYSTFVQKIDNAGVRQWGNTGVQVVPITGFQQSWVQCLTRAGGCTVIGLDGRNGASSIHVGWAAGVSEEGLPEWSNFFSTVVEAKSRTAVANSSQGFHILTFQSGATGAANAYAQNLNFDGTYGPLPPACDPDVNQDGNVDQDDVTYLINVVGGGDNPTNIDPDFNHDGNVDQDDIGALINTVGGGGCP